MQPALHHLIISTRFPYTSLFLSYFILTETPSVHFRPIFRSFPLLFSLQDSLRPCTDLWTNQSKRIPFASASARAFSGQTLTCTSPICCFRSINMQTLDWPIPPPILSGIFSLSNNWWKKRSFRSRSFLILS